MGLFIDRGGYVDAERITKKPFPLIERGKLEAVNGIVVHQTNGPTATSSFNSYSRLDRNGDAPKGAHFMIDRDGTIYQTASLFRVTNHVGFLQSRCVLTKQCTPTELKNANAREKIKGNSARAKTIHAAEKVKNFPDRFPKNEDAVGIEIVGMSYQKDGGGKPSAPVYEPVNDQQNASLAWLVKQLTETFNVPMREVYKHPQIGRKTESEASTAKW
jgi:N-acetyl-anhydromuramyl-L-alanine amidase AmpD